MPRAFYVSECIAIDSGEFDQGASEAAHTLFGPLNGRLFFVKFNNLAYRWAVGEPPQMMAVDDVDVENPYFYSMAGLGDDYTGGYAYSLLGFEDGVSYLKGSSDYDFAVFVTLFFEKRHQAKDLVPLFHVVLPGVGEAMVDLLCEPVILHEELDAEVIK